MLKQINFKLFYSLSLMVCLCHAFFIFKRSKIHLHFWITRSVAWLVPGRDRLFGQSTLRNSFHNVGCFTSLNKHVRTLLFRTTRNATKGIINLLHLQEKLNVKLWNSSVLFPCFQLLQRCALGITMDLLVPFELFHLRSLH